MNTLITLANNVQFEQIARNFKQAKEDSAVSESDDPNSPLRLNLARLNDKGFMLRQFQHHIKELVDAYHIVLCDDELIEALSKIDDLRQEYSKWVGDDEIMDDSEFNITDPDFLAVIDWIKEFEGKEPWCTVLAVVPVDMDGTVAAIVKMRRDEAV